METRATPWTPECAIADQRMNRNKNGYTVFAQGVIFGSLVGAALALRYIYRKATPTSDAIPLKSVPVKDAHASRSSAREEHVTESAEHGQPPVGWRLARSLVRFVVVIAALRIKRS